MGNKEYICTDSHIRIHIHTTIFDSEIQISISRMVNNIYSRPISHLLTLIIAHDLLTILGAKINDRTPTQIPELSTALAPNRHDLWNNRYFANLCISTQIQNARLEQRIDYLEKNMDRHVESIDKLEKVFLEQKIKDLETKLEHEKQLTNKKLKNSSEYDSLILKIDALEIKLSNQEKKLNVLIGEKQSQHQDFMQKIDELESKLLEQEIAFNSKLNEKLAKQEHKSSIATWEKSIVELRTKSRSPVYFKAGIKSHLDWKEDKIVKFNEVTLNEGSGYNSFTGLFTAPVSGTYLMIAKILKFTKSTYYDIMYRNHVTKHTAIICRGYDSSAQYAQNVCSTLVNLKKGDEVYVRFSAGRLYGVSGSYQSFFNGILIG